MKKLFTLFLCVFFISRIIIAQSFETVNTENDIKIKKLSLNEGVFTSDYLPKAWTINYEFSQTNEAYTEITGGTLHEAGSGADDDNYNAVNIGFTFTYNGNPYTQVSINANGFLALGATVSSSYTALSTGTSNQVIAALNADLQGNTGGEVRSELIGTSPNQVFVIQWKDFKNYGSGGNGDSYNFQIRLHETTNIVEIIYGSFVKNSTNRTVQVGMRGASNADFYNRTTTTDWSATTQGSTNSASCTLTQTIIPSTGLKFNYTPIIPPAIDAGITAVISPISGKIGTKDIIAVIKNFGTTTMTSCEIIYKVNGVTVETKNWTGSLLYNTNINDTLSYLFDVEGDYTIEVNTNLTGDEDNSNDLASKTVSFYDFFIPPYAYGFETMQTDQTAVGGFYSQESSVGAAFWIANSTLTNYNRTPRTGSWNAYVQWGNTDWLFTPEFSLEGGVNYKFSVYARQDGSIPTDATISLAYGTAAGGAAMIDTFLMESGVTNGDYQEFVGFFAPATTGSYYLGILGYISSSPWYLSIDDILLEEVLLNDAELLSFLSPNQFEISGLYDVSVELRNNGVNALTACDINYNIEGVTGTYSWTGNLGVNETETVIIYSGFDFSSLGMYDISANVVAAGDEDPSNNEIMTSTYIYAIGESIYSNGPIITHPGGPGEADFSRLQNSSLGMTTLGTNHTGIYRVADDFVVPEGQIWTINGFGFWAYQTNSGLASTMTGVNMRLWNGNPMDGGNILFDYSTMNSLVGSSWDSIYRDSETTVGNTSRPLMKDTAVFQTVVLSEGTYWIDWQTNGSLASGPWVAPITITGADTTGNSLQYSGTEWLEFKDGGTNTPPQGLPFEIFGSIEQYYAVNFSVAGSNGSLIGEVDGSGISDGDLILEGSTVVFTAIPDIDYQVKEWTLNGEIVEGNTTNTLMVEGLDGPVVVTVEFELIGTVEYNVTFNVDMSQPIDGGYFVEGSDQLFIGTNINEWLTPGSDPDFEMFESTTDNIYTLTIMLADGDYFYKYFKILDGTPSWENGEWAGDPNRSFNVDGADVTLNDVWIYETGIDNMLTSIHVYPNPAKGMFTVKVTEPLLMKIIDVTGKVMKETKIYDQEIVTLQNSGIYFLRFSNEKSTGTLRIVIE